MMENRALEKYEKLIKRVALGTKDSNGRPLAQNSVNSLEDVTQELWIKLIKSLSYIHSCPEEEQEIVARKILKNKMYDLARASMRRPDTTWNKISDTPTEEGVNIFDKILGDELGLVGNIIGTPINTEEAYNHKEISERILSWGRLQDPQTYTYLREMVDPSETTMEAWEALSESCETIRSAGFITGRCMAKILQMSERKVDTIAEKLASYLYSQGYKFRGFAAGGKPLYNGRFAT